PATMSLVSSATVWLLSRCVHFAVRRLGLAPSVATEAWMVSPAENEVSGVAMVLLASMALPRVTLAVLAGAGAGAGAGGGVVAGVVSAGVEGVATGAGSSRLQPARAAAPTRAANRAWVERVRFMAVSSRVGFVG